MQVNNDKVIELEKKLQLLIIQPTPFCNLSCSYCYLPDRNNKNKMEFSTLTALVEDVFGNHLPSTELSVIWHAGEPLVVSQKWYQQAFQIIDQYKTDDVNITHHFQTNAVLINLEWCNFFKKHQVKIGISIDGPHFLHNRNRLTRDGHGTHEQVMSAIRLLNEKDIPFHVICVLDRYSLAFPDEIFDFFLDLGVSYLCFNIEEIEADNKRSSLNASGVDLEFKDFYIRIIDRLRLTPGKMRIREIDNVIAMLRDKKFGKKFRNSQNEPGRIISVSWDGSYTTYSPELLGESHPKFGSLTLGNFLYDHFPICLDTERFKEIDNEIVVGINQCKKECKYFDFCLGGVPANKLAEKGSFEVTETMFCHLTVKTLVNAVLETLEDDLSNNTNTNWYA